MSSKLSIVVPVFNEEESLPLLARSIREAMREMPQDYELIFIDDGSTDRSGAVILDLKKDYPQIKLLTFRRNFGQTAALSAGFDQAAGDIIVTLDADLQNDPADIPLLVKKLEEGYDLVSG